MTPQWWPSEQAGRGVRLPRPGVHRTGQEGLGVGTLVPMQSRGASSNPPNGATPAYLFCSFHHFSQAPASLPKSWPVMAVRASAAVFRRAGSRRQSRSGATARAS